MVCSLCGKPGKGKFCTADSGKMIEPQEAGAQPTPVAPPPSPQEQSTTVIIPQINETPPVPSQPQPQIQTNPVPPSQPPTQQNMPLSDDNTITFSGNGMCFAAKDGDVIGRKTGNFVNLFSGQSYVSGTHCKIIKINNVWHIQDLDSSNGTFVQGNKLMPNVPYPLSNNVSVKISTLDFVVTFNNSGNAAPVDDGATIRV